MTSLPLTGTSTNKNENLLPSLLGALSTDNVEQLAQLFQSTSPQLIWDILLQYRTDKQQHNVVFLMAQTGSTQCLRYLLEVGGEGTNRKALVGLFQRLGNPLGNSGAPPFMDTGVDSDDASPLFFAAGLGHLAVVDILLASGTVDVNGVTKDGMSPLMMACANGHTAVVRRLLQLNATNLTLRDKSGKNAVMLAAFRGADECLLALLQSHGRVPNVNDQDNFGWTALMFATNTGHRNTCRLLMKTGKMDLSLVTVGTNLTAVDLAKNPETARILDPNAKGPAGSADSEKAGQSEEKRSWWLWYCIIVTILVPGYILERVGIKTQTAQLAWREKMGLCSIIFWLSLVIGAIGLGVSTLFCRPIEPITPERIQTEFALDSPSNSKYVIIRGKLHDVGILIRTNSHPPGGPAAQEPVKAYVGKDASKLFPLSETSCPTAPKAVGCTGKACHVGPFVPQSLGYLFRGQMVAYSWEVLEATPKRYAVLSDMVYDVQTYLDEGDFYLGEEYTQVLQDHLGKDLTLAFSKLDVPANIVKCMDENMLAGQLEGISSGCLASALIILMMMAVLALIMMVRFICAVAFSWNSALKLRKWEKTAQAEIAAAAITNAPVNHHSTYVICLVTCYSEGTDALVTTFDSIAESDYPDQQKLLFIVADGQIVGHGNNKTTAELVLGMMDVDETLSVQSGQPQLYSSIGEDVINRAQVYAGFYKHAKRRVPTILISKCGLPTETTKPGNRGKRDSQLILMRFLMNVHINERLNPLEYEIFQTIYKMTSVYPDRYGLVLMIDADTEIKADALGILVTCMENDEKIIGLCGETEISNQVESWVTSIQIYEYFMSHHLGKAFESIFGGVTCLPGCFCMYRIREITKNRVVPFLASPDIVEAYSENNVHSLHKKNLLHLGEDRFLTTLMLKTFPRRDISFVPKAIALTTVPEKFSILLSQRRRWINSTVHNLLELVTLNNLCGIFCCSMQFVIFTDLLGTVTTPAAYLFLVYMIVQAATLGISFYTILAIAFTALTVFLQLILVFLTSKRYDNVFWLIVYLLATPIWQFILPVYAFWKFDDFSWGATRKVKADVKKEDDGEQEEDVLDSSSVPLLKWQDWELMRRKEEQNSSSSNADALRKRNPMVQSEVGTTM